MYPTGIHPTAYCLLLLESTNASSPIKDKSNTVVKENPIIACFRKPTIVA